VRRARLNGSDWHACRLPFRKAIFQAAGLHSPLAQRRHCLEGEYTSGSAALGHDFARVRQFGKPVSEFRQGNVEGTQQMPCVEFVAQPDVEDKGAVWNEGYRRWRCSLLGQITERREAGLLGRRTTAGAAFIAIKAKRPPLQM
jgi:hypothetical protein